MAAGGEVTRLVVAWGFGALGLHRIQLEVLAVSTRAIHCYLACGGGSRRRVSRAARRGRGYGRAAGVCAPLAPSTGADVPPPPGDRPGSHPKIFIPNGPGSPPGRPLVPRRPGCS